MHSQLPNSFSAVCLPSAALDLCATLAKRATSHFRPQHPTCDCLCDCYQAACGLFDDLQAYKEAAVHEQQGFHAPPGLSKPALRNHTALDALLNHEIAQQESKSGALPAADLVAAADELADLAPNVAKVDLLRHSHALHQEDYLAAVDTLYKYFDYSTGESASHFPCPASSSFPQPAHAQSFSHPCVPPLASLHAHIKQGTFQYLFCHAFFSAYNLSG